MAQNIEEEALEAIESLKNQSGQDIKIEQNFNIHIFNILWRIATNTRYNVSIREIKKVSQNHLTLSLQHFQHDDPFISNQVKELQKTFENIPKIAFFPLLRHIIPETIGYNQALNYYKRQKELFWEMLQDRENEYDNDSPPKVVNLFQYYSLIPLNITVYSRTLLMHTLRRWAQMIKLTDGTSLEYVWTFLKLVVKQLEVPCHGSSCSCL